MTTQEPIVHVETGTALKLILWGASMSGKTSILSVFHAIKRKDDPDAVYKFLKLEDKVTERTIGFDQATFGIGEKKEGKHDFKYHLFTVPGQSRFKAMRKIVSKGLNGLIIVLNSEKSEWEANKRSLKELLEQKELYEQITNGQVSLQIILNKMDLPAEERITEQEAAKLLVEGKIAKDMGEALVMITMTSCVEAVREIAPLIKSGNWDPNNRPPAVTRIITPIQRVLRECIIIRLGKK